MYLECDLCCQKIPSKTQFYLIYKGTILKAARCEACEQKIKDDQRKMKGKLCQPDDLSFKQK